MQQREMWRCCPGLVALSPDVEDGARANLPHRRVGADDPVLLTYSVHLSISPL